MFGWLDGLVLVGWLGLLWLVGWACFGWLDGLVLGDELDNQTGTGKRVGMTSLVGMRLVIHEGL